MIISEKGTELVTKIIFRIISIIVNLLLWKTIASRHLIPVVSLVFPVLIVAVCIET